jgi:hypothetical protein
MACFADLSENDLASLLGENAVNTRKVVFYQYCCDFYHIYCEYKIIVYNN